jgi:hypothetical protein
MGYFVKNRRLQSGSTGVVLPTGSTAQRPTAPVFGLIRYNTDSGGFVEFFDGTNFQSLAVGGGISYQVDTFAGDGSTLVFGPLSEIPANAEQIVVFVGSIYQAPVTNYTVDGVNANVTFTSAPPPGIPINVITSNS